MGFLAPLIGMGISTIGGLFNRKPKAPASPTIDPWMSKQLGEMRARYGGLGYGARGAQDTSLKATDPALDYYLGTSPEKSPLYRTALNQDVSSTSRAYDSVKSAMRARALQSGLGYQPTENAGETQIGMEEAGQLAGAPGRALSMAIEPQLRAIALKQQEAGQYGQRAGQMLGAQLDTQGQQVGLEESRMGGEQRNADRSMDYENQNYGRSGDLWSNIAQGASTGLGGLLAKLRRRPGDVNTRGGFGPGYASPEAG